MTDQVLKRSMTDPRPSTKGDVEDIAGSLRRIADALTSPTFSLSGAEHPDGSTWTPRPDPIGGNPHDRTPRTVMYGNTITPEPVDADDGPTAPRRDRFRVAITSMLSSVIGPTNASNWPLTIEKATATMIAIANAPTPSPEGSLGFEVDPDNGALHITRHPTPRDAERSEPKKLEGVRSVAKGPDGTCTEEQNHTVDHVSAEGDTYPRKPKPKRWSSL